MKILMVNKFLYPRGGSESYMLALGEQLQKSGHEVEYFGMYDEKNTVGNSAGQYTGNMDFHSNGLARFLYPFKILFSFEAKRKIGKVIDTFKPDIVHMNNINFQLTPSIIYAVKKRKIPLVQTVHDYQMICPNHLLYNFDKNEPCEKCLEGSNLACVENKCIHGSLVKSILGAIEGKLYSLLKTYKKVDLFICPSNFLERKLLGAKGFYRGRTFTIHNFINKDRFRPNDDARGDYIVFVGRLSKEKGVSLLAETAKLLPEQSFTVVGSGPDEEALLGIGNIKMAGFLTGDELWQVMSGARLLILPSVCFENCPLSILEAHSMGVPVVTMKSGGMAELVKDGITGSLVDTPEPSLVAEKIKEVLSDVGHYDKLCSNCRAERENILSIEEYCKILIEKYESLKK